MEAKEKAKEIVESYCNMDILKDYDGMDISIAKQCALIHVNGIIEELKEEIWFSYCEDNNLPERTKFWKEVLKEINNL